MKPWFLSSFELPQVLYIRIILAWNLREISIRNLRAYPNIPVLFSVDRYLPWHLIMRIYVSGITSFESRTLALMAVRYRLYNRDVMSVQ